MKSNCCCCFLLACLLTVTSTPLYSKPGSSATGTSPAEQSKQQPALPPLINLQRSKIVPIPDKYWGGDDFQCDADGRVYAYVRSAGFTAVRYGLDLQVEQVFSLPETEQFKNYSFGEFGPTPDGGLVVVGNPPRSDVAQLLVRFDNKGHVTSAVPIKPKLRELSPERFAFFPDGMLVGADLRTVSYGSRDARQSSTGKWLVAILNQDGTIVKQLSMDESALFSRSMDGNSESSTAVSNDIRNTVEKRQLRLYPSSNGNVYAGNFNAGLAGPELSRNFGLAEISPSGEVTYYSFPSTNGPALYGLAINGNKVFAVFGSESGVIKEVYSFRIDGSNHRLDLVGRYIILGELEPSGRGGELSPAYVRLQCATDSGLIGSEGRSLVLYRLP